MLIRVPAESLESLGTKSRAMQELVRMARRVAAADSTVFLLGETGSGKERLARAIHAASPRREAPFVAVNCAALPESLLESELFGHERGAFTGATRSRRGHFELAHGGTLFLDEIAEMAPPLQGKLLRTLQERRIQRLGSERSLAVDVRILTATSRDVAAEMERDAFRRDLYYRLAVVTLTVPPLRERLEDLPDLVENILETLGRRLGRVGVAVSGGAMAALAGYRWPGNVRELRNAIERAVLLGDGVLDVAELTPGLVETEIMQFLERVLEKEPLGRPFTPKAPADVVEMRRPAPKERPAAAAGERVAAGPRIA